MPLSEHHTLAYPNHSLPGLLAVMVASIIRVVCCAFFAICIIVTLNLSHTVILYLLSLRETI